MADAPTWHALFDEAAARLGNRGEARRIVEHVTGLEFPSALDEAVTNRAVAYFDSLLDRRAKGEPLQYVLGRWGFRHLDVMVDSRVLIPRPETEVVVEHALEVIDDLGASVAVDLGTGSGVIALSLAVERPALSIWATDASPAALDVARANLAGIGRAATSVQLVAGDWFGALPAEVRGTVDVIVSNPPYVADGDPLPAEVADWEPRDALLAGPTGLEAIETILAAAPSWLAPNSALVLEIGETQTDAAIAAASGAGFDAHVRPDLTGRPRVLIARRRA